MINELCFEVLNILERAGYEAYLIGGSVRDYILGLETDDIDISTNAEPYEIKECFNSYETLDVGIKYGTVTLFYKNNKFEITTYRKDIRYDDSRHPLVEFTHSFVEDVKRRDFTINAIAMDKNKNIIDICGGLKDIKKSLIRTIGDAKKRFEEDYLRMLRAVRFSSVLDFSLDKDIAKNIKILSPNINKLSKERIRQELNKIMLSDNIIYAFNLLHDLKLLKYIIPELDFCYNFNQNNPHHIYDLFDHILLCTSYTKPNLIVRMAALLHDIGKPYCKSTDGNNINHYYGHDKESAKMAERILKRLRYENNFISSVVSLIYNHMCQDYNIGLKGVYRLKKKVGEDNFNYLLNLLEADSLSSNCNKDLHVYNKIYELNNQLKNRNISTKKNILAIDGYDLINMGYKPSNVFKEIFTYLEDIVLEDASLNDPIKLKEIIKKHFKLEEYNEKIIRH